MYFFYMYPKCLTNPPKRSTEQKKTVDGFFREIPTTASLFARATVVDPRGRGAVPLLSRLGRVDKFALLAVRLELPEAKKKMSTWTRLKWIMLDKYCLIIYVLISFFAVPQVAGPGGGFLSFWTRFRTDFRRFVIAETLVFTVFFCFLHAWRLASKLPKTS